MSWPDIPDNIMQTCIDVFGVSCTFKPKTGGSYPFEAIFDKRFKVVDAGTGMSVLTEAPNVSIRVSDLPQAPKRDDGIDVGVKSYKVRDYRPDGQGGALVVLYE
jgi:hypothetical protein